MNRTRVSEPFFQSQNGFGMGALAAVLVCIAGMALSSCHSVKSGKAVFPAKRDFVIYADDAYYASFPEIILMKDRLVLYFERQNLSALRASPLHPHYQPAAEMYFAISDDWGQSWRYSEESPELKDVLATTRTCFALPGDEFLDMRYRYIHGTMKIRHFGPTIFQGVLYKNPVYQGLIDEPGPCPKAGVWKIARLGDGSLLASTAAECGDPLPTPPAEGKIYQDEWPTGYRTSTIAFLKGTPDGRHWIYLSHIPNRHAFAFTEPEMTVFPDGRVVAMIRTDWNKVFREIRPKDAGDSEEAYGYYLYQSESLDWGKTWSEPVQLPIWGHPANLVQLKSGNVLMVYGHRRSPRSIRTIVSRDQCRTWDMKTLKMLKTWTPGNYDFGYPVAAQLPDGRIFCCFYGYSTKDVGEKMPHGIFGTIFPEEWLLQEEK